MSISKPVVGKTLLSVFLLAGMSSFSANAESATALLPDTGQSVQYDTKGNVLAKSESSLYTGQDASVQGNPRPSKLRGNH